ncbi:MAG: alpha/beta fold hydrolase [Myxococcales bacterium]|nr:alpha/beta fold hydrolase [Myxococcales bacterium]
METNLFYPETGDGWQLYLKRSRDPGTFNARLRPLAIVPGYGMNSFILGYHPNGLSMVEYLTGAGFEVWTMNLRSQEGTTQRGGPRDYGFREIVREDLPAVFEIVRAKTRSRRKRIDVIGCSLGGTYVYAYAALHRRNPLASIVGLGAPLRWVEIHPALRVAFSSPALIGKLRLFYTRQLCRLGLPIAARIPKLLHLYLHPEIVDLSQSGKLVQTVEDPNPRLNREIAEWIRDRDLTIDGVNISEAFRQVTNPLLCLTTNADGIVPLATALTALDLASSAVKDTHVAGTNSIPMAHADLYISRYAQEQAFVPLSNWLLARYNT